MERYRKGATKASKMKNKILKFIIHLSIITKEEC